MRTSNPTVDQTADDAADMADTAIRSSQRFANQALDQIADRVDSVRERANAALSSVKSETQALTKRGVDAVREGSQQLRQQALRASDSTAAYVKDEPLKSVLIAAAVGAGLMALIGLMVSRSRD
jgi:ElaB/YqjD/DUF883 family membrane-anchored ribosome-binding protein